MALIGKMGRWKAQGGGGGGDVDALDYFSRAEALGGSFDQTAISGTYTESYVKTAITDMIKGLKSDGAWSKITELYLLSGVTFAGLMAKVKYDSTATLTNLASNFVTGDYAGAGTGAGLIGNAFSKSLDSSYTITGAEIGDLSMGVYGNNFATDASNTTSFCGFRSGTAVVQIGAPFGQHIHFGNPGRVNFSPGSSTGFMLGYSSASNIRIFRNGTFNAAFGGAGTYTGTPNSFKLFQNGDVAELAGCRLKAAFAGTTMTDSDCGNLSTRINDLMTALGCNEY